MLDLSKEHAGFAQVRSLSLIVYRSIRAGNKSLTDLYKMQTDSYEVPTGAYDVPTDL